MRRGEGILRVLRKHLHNKLSPHTMPNWVRRDLIVLVVVLAVRIPHSHIGQSYVQRTHTRPTLLQYSGVRRLVEWSKGFIQTHTEDESE